MTGCAATGAKTPASPARARRHAAASTALVAGRRPVPVSAGAAIRSARRSTVSTDSPATPPRPATPRARTRLATTPHRFAGTSTLTGASGSPSLASATASPSASYAGAPYDVHTTGMTFPRALMVHLLPNYPQPHKCRTMTSESTGRPALNGYPRTAARRPVCDRAAAINTLRACGSWSHDPS